MVWGSQMDQATASTGLYSARSFIDLDLAVRVVGRKRPGKGNAAAAILHSTTTREPCSMHAINRFRVASVGPVLS